MVKIININQRGTVTLPKDIRQKFGLEQGGQVVVENTAEGVLLKPGVTFPVETYSKDRLKQFEQTNEETLRDYDIPAK